GADLDHRLVRSDTGRSGNNFWLSLAQFANPGGSIVTTPSGNCSHRFRNGARYPQKPRGWFSPSPGKTDRSQQAGCIDPGRRCGGCYLIAATSVQLTLHNWHPQVVQDNCGPVAIGWQRRYSPCPFLDRYWDRV